MNRSQLPWGHLAALLLLFSVPFLIDVSSAQAQEDIDLSDDEVIIEINPLVQDPETGQYYLPAYVDRRSSWGVHFGVFYRPIAPKDFLSPHDQVAYSTIYGEEAVGLIEVQLGLQWNMPLGSFGFEFAGGSGSLSRGERSLNLSTLKGSMTWYVNNLFPEPYVVPFVKTGLYQLSFEDNKTGSPAQSDSLSPALFFSGGLLLQLDWIEPKTAVRSYLDYGIENAYLVFEITQYQNTSNETEPNFSSGPNMGGGLLIEF